MVFLGGLSQGFSTITMQLAGNLFPEEINRQKRGHFGHSPQDPRGSRRLRDREAVHQEPDPRAVPQPDQPGQQCVRCRGRGAAVLRQVGAGAERGRGGHARRAAEGAGHVQPAQAQGQGRPAAQPRHRRDARRRLSHGAGGRKLEGVSADALVAQRLPGARGILRRVRAAADAGEVRQRSVQGRLPDLHHARPRRAAGRRQRARIAA